MIEAKGLTKRFDDITAIDHIDVQIKDGSVFGLVGTNGAGKSTFLRILSGILKPDEGSVTIDGEDVYENTAVKSRFFYISDDQYFFSNSTPLQLMDFYCSVYPKFDTARFDRLMESFDLDRNRKINTFSKGMKKQVSVICGVCACTDYLFCDETFDGLDPVMRQAVKSIFTADMKERNLTPVIASHNLRELEDICDHVGLLHKGGILLSKDIDEMKLDVQKIQCVFPEGTDVHTLDIPDVVNIEERGRLVTVTMRGTRDEAMERIALYDPVFCEAIPLSLEEIFISETEVAGYDIKKLVL